MRILEVDSVTMRFGGLVAVDQVSVEVEQGEIIGLIGPNGAGKTTLFNVISGAFPPTSGDVRFNGRSILGQMPHQVCKLGLTRTFQIVKPFARMTTLANVAVGAFNVTNDLGEARKIASEVLQLTGLWPKRDYPAKSLTIADLKRLEMARALATRPRLLLLDEVMAGLNPAEIVETLKLMKQIRDKGVTLFVIEHVMHAVMSLCERIVVIHHGAKIAEGPPSAIARDKAVIEAYLGEEYLLA